MILACPECKKSFDLDVTGLNEIVEKACEDCHSLLRIKRVIEVDLIKRGDSQPQPSAVQTEEVPPLDEKKALVAVEGSATREITREVLNDAGFEVIESSTGREALFHLKKFRPAIAVVDVGLPQIFGFEVCEIIKKSQILKDTGVILVASIYDKAKYKREPDSLYGADDYIERHHIRDDLFFKIKKILGVKGRGKTLAEETKETIREPIGPSGSTEIGAKEAIPASPAGGEDHKALEVKPEPLPCDPEEHEAAKRLARIILSDIALYNQKAINEGIKNNTFHQVLKDDLEEGRRLFNSRVSKEIREVRDYYKEAVEDFIAKRRKSVISE